MAPEAILSTKEQSFDVILQVTDYVQQDSRRRPYLTKGFRMVVQRMLKSGEDSLEVLVDADDKDLGVNIIYKAFEKCLAEAESVE